MVCNAARGLIDVVLCGQRIGWRHGDEFSGARYIALGCGAGEQPVVADAVEPLGQDVEQEAPMNSSAASVIVR